MGDFEEDLQVGERGEENVLCQLAPAPRTFINVKRREWGLGRVDVVGERTFWIRYERREGALEYSFKLVDDGCLVDGASGTTLTRSDLKIAT